MIHLKYFITVFSLLVLLSAVGTHHAQAAPQTATLKVSPASSTVTVNSEFSVNLLVDTGGQSASYVTVDVNYSNNLEYVRFDASGSVFSTALFDPTPSGNHFKLERTRTDAGYNGSNGQILKVTFKAIAAGTGTVTINKAASEVLAYEDSSNILQTVANGSYTLQSAPATGSTATPATATATPATTTTPSVIKSTIEVKDSCAMPDGKETTVLLATIKDSKGAVLKGDMYKPVVSVTPSGAKSTVKAVGDSWEVSSTNIEAEKVSVSITTKGVRLGTKDVTFKADCALPTPVPAATTVASPTVLPTLTPTPVVSATPRVLIQENSFTPRKLAGVIAGVVNVDRYIAC